MRRSDKAFALLLLILALLSVYALRELFAMRFERGDVYPPYSSLRSDPLGAKAYYEGLGDLKDVSVSRNYRDIPVLPADGSATVYLLGVDGRALRFVHEKELFSLEQFVVSGGRIVMALMPAGEALDKEIKIKEKELKKRPEKKEGEEEGETCPEDPEDSKQRVSLYDRWGFRTALQAREGATKGPFHGTAERTPVRDGLPQSISWHSRLYLELTGEGWENVYTVQGMPVLAEKRLGAGTVVLATDSYFVSNEAILRERRTQLLAWLAGPYRTIIFDESHHGVLEQPGVMTLVDKYGLQGTVAAALLLALLFVWKNSASLVPRKSDGNGEEVVLPGKDHRAGFVSLLRRNIPTRDILRQCVEAWRRAGRGRGLPKDRIEAVEEHLASVSWKSLSAGGQVKAYRKITEILSKRGTHERQN